MCQDGLQGVEGPDAPLLECHPQGSHGVLTALQVQLKGHRSVGGMRASVYNSMPLEGAKALAAFMQVCCWMGCTGML